MIRKRSALAAALAATSALVAGTAGSSGASSGGAFAHITGAWKTTVNRPAPAPPLASLQVFSAGGGFVETANEPSAARTPQLGTWKRIGVRLYAATGLMFRFDPQTGAHVATIKINRNIRLSPDGDTFRVTARATTYDPNGNVLSSFPVTGTGERIEVERIPELP